MDSLLSRMKKVTSKSWGQECCLCSSTHGVPIECSARGCKQAYHTTCAIRGKLKMQAIFGKNYKGGIRLRSYCKEHGPDLHTDNGGHDDRIDATGVKEIDMTNLVDDRLQEGNEELDYFWKYVDINKVHKNISDIYSRNERINSLPSEGEHDEVTHSPPRKKAKKSDDSLVNKSSTTKVKPKNGKSMAKLVSKRDEVDPILIDLIYRYWMLLRTANNGQSLIKFSLSALKEREFEQKKNILKLRIELERVRNLSYMIGKREKLKAAWLKAHQNILKRTIGVINDLNPAIEYQGETNKIEQNGNSNNLPSSSSSSSNNCHHQKSANNYHTARKSQLANGMFDESDQLISDLINCDAIYEMSTPNLNCNHSNLSHQERSTLERRRTLSLVRRINRQLKSVNMEPALNPYAKSYLALKRTDSPTPGASAGTNLISKLLKSR